MKDKKRWIAWFMIITLLLGMNAGIQPTYASSSGEISTTSRLTTAQDFQSINIEVSNDKFSTPTKYDIDFGTTGLTSDDISYVERVSDTQITLYINNRPLAGTIQITIPIGGFVNQNGTPSNTISIVVSEPIKEGDFYFYNGDVVGYDGSDSDLIIPNTINGQAVTGIGQRTFDQLYLKSVIIPDTVTRIDDYAFQSCGLKSLNLPSGLQSIGRYAFNGNSFTELTFPVGISVISEGAFNSNRFRMLTIPNTIKRIEKNAFRYNTNLQDVTFPEGLEYIGEDAFFGCNALMSVTIPSSVTGFGSGAFEACQKLRTVYFLGNEPQPTAHVFNGSNPALKIYVAQGATGYAGVYSETFDPTEVHEVDFNAGIGIGPVPGLISGTICSKHIAPDKGMLTNEGYRLVVWNTEADGSGVSYRPGDVITMGTSNITLYAMWLPVYDLTQNPSISHGSITIESNGISVNSAIVDEQLHLIVTPDVGYRVAEHSVYYSFNGQDVAITNRESEYDFFFSMPHGDTIISAYFEPSTLDFSACYVGGIWSVTAYYGSTKDVIIPSVVNGTKAMRLYEALFFYDDDVTRVTVDEGYTTLSEYFLNEVPNLVSVYLPDTLTTLDSYAIANAGAIDRIRIPELVSSIVDDNFVDCTNLSSLIFEGDAPTIEPAEIVVPGPPIGPGSIVTFGELPVDSTKDFLQSTQDDLVIYHKTGAVGFDQAPWTAFNQQTYDFMLKYHHNGATSGYAPAEVMLVSAGSTNVQGNTGNLVRPGYTFEGWNTKADGTGTHYAENASLSLTQDMILYAQWHSNTPDNGGGTPPVTPDPTPTPSPTPGPSTPTTGASATPSETVTPVVKVDEKGNVTASVTDKQVEESIAYVEKQDADQNLVIKVDSKAGTTSIETDLSLKALKALADSSVKGLTLESQIASISFDAQTLEGIANTSEGDLKIAASKVALSSLSEAAQTEVANRPVYEFKVTSGDKTISEFGGNVTVKLPYTPAEGEDLNAIVIYYVKADGTLEMVSNCRYDATSGTIDFVTNHFSMYAVGYHKVTFSDVNETAWYRTAVEFLASREIITGKAEQTFKPLDQVTRGEFMTMILRAYGIEPDSNNTNNFADAGDQYYTGYLAAAKKLGITDGIGNNLFAPERAISRQEMSSMLYSAMTVLGQPPVSAVSLSLDDFSDATDIDTWAKDPMLSLIKAGILNGKQGQLNPQGIASRAEVAQILYKVLKPSH